MGEIVRTVGRAAKILGLAYQKLGVKGALVVAVGIAMVYVLDEDWPVI
jgi:hypothetical protein